MGAFVDEGVCTLAGVLKVSVLDVGISNVLRRKAVFRRNEMSESVTRYDDMTQGVQANSPSSE